MSTAISNIEQNTNENDKEWVSICQDQDLINNTGLCALHDGKQIAIFKIAQAENISNINVDQDLYAISNYDPIGKANVLSRGILGNIGEQLVVASPLYKQHFDLNTGECLEDPDQNIKTYQVRRFNNEIQLKKTIP
jgi:nitrite reductase (NADH) small subunit